MQFTVLKTSNEIEDICIAYGLCKILDENMIDFELENLKSKIIIKTEDFEINELIFNGLEIEECINVNSSMSLSDQKSELKSLNPFIKENLINIFQYFNTLDKKFLTKQTLKKVSAVGVGTCYSTLGIRGGYTFKALKISEYIRHLSFLGWVYGVSYISNDNIEISTILIPKQTNQIYKPYQFIKPAKDEEPEKIMTCLKGNKEASLIAQQYIETLRQYNFIQKDYEKVVFMQLTKAGKKPLADVSFELPIYEWSNELLESFSKTLRYYSTVDYDVKDITARYIIKPNYNNFNSLIKIYSKNNQIINNKFKEELLKMYNDKIDEIYDNEIINKLGKGLNRLFFHNDKAKIKKKNMCYDIQVQLLSTTSKYHLQKAIESLIFEYERIFKYQLLSDEELLGVIKFIQNNKEAKICANALLALSKVFVNIENKNDNENIKEEM